MASAVYCLARLALDDRLETVAPDLTRAGSYWGLGCSGVGDFLRKGTRSWRLDFLSQKYNCMLFVVFFVSKETIEVVPQKYK